MKDYCICEECMLFDGQSKKCWEGFEYDSEECRKNQQRRNPQQKEKNKQ